MPGAKDLSEIVSNWVTAVGIVAGGLWAFFEWNTLLPKTNAEIQREIASLRARTSGDISVWIGGPPDGEEATTADGRWFADICSEAEAGVAHVTLPVRIRLTLESTSELPVKVTVVSFALADLGGRGYTLHEGAPAAVFQGNTIQPIGEVALGADAFLGGLNWSHVEPGGAAALAVLGSASFPFACSRGLSSWITSDFSIALRTRLEPVLGEDAAVAEPIDRWFVQVCTVQASGMSVCAGGDQPAEEDGGDGSGAPLLKSIAQ